MQALDVAVAVGGVAAAQRGLLTRAQTLSAGMSRGQVDRRVAVGVLSAVHPGVYRLVAAPSTRDQTLLAACLAAGHGAVASHRSAAALWGLRGVDWPAQPEVMLAGTHRPPVRGAVIHDGAGISGRNGTAVLRALVAARTPGQACTESPLEDAIVRMLRRHGLPEPARQHVLRTSGGRTLRLDLAYPDVRLAIEADGRMWHSGRTDFARDRARMNLLAGLSWTLLRFGWHDVGGSGQRLAAEMSRLREVLLRARAG